MTDVQTASGLEDEQEVDLSSAWQRLKLRWWLPIGGLVVGAVVGLVLALSGGSVWRAQTIVYLGQPFAPLGGGQIQSLATNPRTVGEIIRSESALKAASEASGIPVSELRSSISTRELLAAGQLRGHQPAHRDRRQGLRESRRSSRRPNTLATRVTERVSRLRHGEGRSSSRTRSRWPRRSSRPSRRGFQAQEQQDALDDGDQSIALVERLLLSRT